jgi:hypothetical protein
VSAAKDIVKETPSSEPAVKATDADDKKASANTPAAAPAPAGSGDGKTPAKPAPTGKRPLGTKEVIPFEWKLIGDAHDAALTLFKAVERDDVEVQYERVKQEGYYKNLRILDVKAKVEQPKPKKPIRPPSAKKTKKSAAPKTKKTTAKTKKTAAKKRAAPAAKKTTARATAKKSAKKSETKSVKKSTAKKKTAAKSAKKKTAKKKK